MIATLAWFQENAGFFGMLFLAGASYLVGYIDGRLSARIKP